METDIFISRMKPYGYYIVRVYQLNELIEKMVADTYKPVRELISDLKKINGRKNVTVFKDNH